MQHRIQMSGNEPERLAPTPYPLQPCPPIDARRRTSLADLPREVENWLRAALGGECCVAPISELVNTNHAFVVTRGSAKFFLKIIRRDDAEDRLQCETATLRCLDGLPCPQPVMGELLHDRLAVLLTTWLDALPIRHLDFHGVLAPDYMGELGMILSRIHDRLRSVQIPDARSRREFKPDAANLESAAHTFLGAERTRSFLRLWEDAAAWLRGTLWQPVHADLQDKNILLSRSGRLFLCDFEAVCYGPLVCELSVDRIYLKRDLPEENRATLQRLLLDGYGYDPGLDYGGAARVRLLRLGELLTWRSSQHASLEEADGLCAKFDLLARQLTP